MSTILITGASSGIGAALAKAYAKEGEILYLLGRDLVRLEKVADQCAALGARVFTETLEVRDQKKARDFLEKIDQANPIDLAILNAGISNFGKEETEERVRTLFDVNVMGLLNTLFPILNGMKTRKKGQIALMSSLASFKGIAGKGAYAGTKAAIRLYGEGLRESLKKDGILLSVICPGFVDTPLTKPNKFPMPFLMKPEKAARLIKEGLAKDKPRIAFPLPLYVLALSAQILPQCLTAWVARRFMKQS